MHYNFLWLVSQEQRGMVWIKWQALALPKSYGGWGFKIPSLFSKSLAAKNIWRLIKGDGLWALIVTREYIYPRIVLELIQILENKHRNISIGWKVVIKSS